MSLFFVTHHLENKHYIIIIIIIIKSEKYSIIY